MSALVKIGVVFLNSPTGKKLMKNIGIAICMAIAFPIIIISSVNITTESATAIVEKAYNEVKEEKAIDNRLDLVLMIAIEVFVHNNREDMQHEIVKKHIEDDYIKQVIIKVESEPNEAGEVTYTEKEINLFKTRTEVLEHITQKYALSSELLREITVFIAMNSLSGSVVSYDGDFIIPTEAGQVTCSWMCYENHTGTDIGAGEGTNILSTAGGTVLYANNGCIEGDATCGGGFGNYVVIAHNIANVEYITIYAHMTETIVIEKQNIQAGTILGYMGNTGRSEGVHLHFEIIKNINHIPSKGERLTLGVDTETIIQYPDTW